MLNICKLNSCVTYNMIISVQTTCVVGGYFSCNLQIRNAVVLQVARKSQNDMFMSPYFRRPPCSQQVFSTDKCCVNVIAAFIFT